MFDRTFAQEFLQTIDDPGKHGVHLLFNSYWRFMPDDVRQAYVRGLRNDPEVRAWLDARWFPEPYSFESLESLAPGTLGREYHRHIVDNNLNREIAAGYRAFHESLEASGALDGMPDDVKYAVLRGFQTHDLLHIVTGLDTTGLGEIALQSFCMAQMRSLYFAIWISVVTTRAAFLQPDSSVPLMDAVMDGWSLGRNVGQLQTVAWEHHLDRPVLEIRREFRIPEHRMMKTAA